MNLVSVNSTRLFPLSSRLAQPLFCSLFRGNAPSLFSLPASLSRKRPLSQLKITTNNNYNNNNNNNNNNNKLNHTIHNALLNQQRTTTNLLLNTIAEREKRERRERKFFHSTQPRHAGVHAFRLASFVAPIVMRQVRTWIGTPSTNTHFMRRLISVIALILGIPAVYVYTHLENTPYTDRVRFVALTSDDEDKLGEYAFSQLIEEHIDNFIPGHHHFVSKVTDVAQRIIDASDRPDIKWEVRLIDSPVTNAFAIPGGKIFVFSGLLDVTQNDDGLAFILGHEVAHVLARHGAEQMTIGRVMLGVSVMLSALFGDNVASFALSRAISLLTEMKYSRHMEREADYIGLMLMNKAKYDINEAPRVWERMMQQMGDNSIPFLSTHPSHGDRIQDISKWVQEIKAETQNNL